MTWTVIRYLADASHALSKAILIHAIHANGSAEGVSLLTQAFYLVVFLARYAPYPLWPSRGSGMTAFEKVYSLIFKVTYIGSSAYTLLIMTRVFARTREKEIAARAGWYSAGLMLFVSPFVMLIFTRKARWTFAEWSWTFSITLESVVVIPQLLLLRQTHVPTVLDSFYLVALGFYRFFYLLNWLVDGLTGSRNWDIVSIIFGVIQTLFYVDFAWVYWSRQRVKLRGGALVDSDDYRKGWLVKRLLRRPRNSFGGDAEAEADDEVQGGPGARRASSNKWGPRGISVSADEGVQEAQEIANADGELADPAAFEDDDLPGYVDDAPSSLAAPSPSEAKLSLGTGSEWRD